MEILIVPLVIIAGLCLIVLRNMKFQKRILLLDIKYQAEDKTRTFPSLCDDMVLHFYNNSQEDIQGFDGLVNFTDDMDNPLGHRPINWYGASGVFRAGGHLDVTIPGNLGVDNARKQGRTIKTDLDLYKILFTKSGLTTPWISS